MELKIDLNAKFLDMQPSLVAYPEIALKCRSIIKENVPRGTFDFFCMTVSEFLQLQEGRLPVKVTELLGHKETTLKTYIQVLNTFESGFESMQSIIENTTIKASPEEVMSQSGLLEMTAEESMTNFLKDFFNLHNYEVAQKISLYEYVTARKVMFNSATFQQNYNELKKKQL